jgi:hypothetical protein
MEIYTPTAPLYPYSGTATPPPKPDDPLNRRFFSQVKQWISTAGIVTKRVFNGLHVFTIEFGKILASGIKRGVIWIQTVTENAELFTPFEYIVQTEPSTTTIPPEPFHEIPPETPRKKLEEEQESSKPKAISASSARGPTHFSDNDFEYNWETGNEQVRTNNPQIDELIEAYETLHINIVKVILEKRQLVDFKFITKRYKKLQKIVHPDKKGGTVLESTQLNLAFEKIKTLMAQGNENIQMDFISHFIIENHSKQSSTTSIAYIMLFGVGATAGVIYRLASPKKKINKNKEIEEKKKKKSFSHGST